MALVGPPLSVVPDALRDHALAAGGPAVGAVVLSTRAGVGRGVPDSAWVQPDTGPPASVEDLAGAWPAEGDRLVVVVDPDRPGRALLADNGPPLWSEVATGMAPGVALCLVVLSWGRFGLSSRAVRRSIGAAVDRAAPGGPASVAASCEVVRSSSSSFSAAPLRERLRRAGEARQEHHESAVLLPDGRTLSARWSEAFKRPRPGSTGVAVGDLDGGGPVVLVLGRHVLWPDDSPVEVHPPPRR